jgi:hypothetical protein
MLQVASKTWRSLVVGAAFLGLAAFGQTIVVLLGHLDAPTGEIHLIREVPGVRIVDGHAHLELGVALRVQRV